MSLDNKMQTTVRLAKRHSGKTISATTLVAVIGMLNMLDINVLDFIVENSSAYETQIDEFKIDIAQLEFENRILNNKLSHFDHITQSQNFMLQKMLQTDLITMQEYLDMVHAASHRPPTLTEEDDSP